MSDPGGAYIQRPEEGELRWMGETSTRFLTAGADTGGAFCLVDERANRGKAFRSTGTRRTWSRSTCWRAS